MQFVIPFMPGEDPAEMMLALIEQYCIGSFEYRPGSLTLGFEREAESFEDAVLIAKNDVRSSRSPSFLTPKSLLSISRTWMPTLSHLLPMWNCRNWTPTKPHGRRRPPQSVTFKPLLTY